MPALPGLNHLNLSVSDRGESRRFYCGILGMTLQWEDVGFLFLRSGEVDLSLMEREPVQVEGIHFGFRLDDPEEVDAWADHLRQHGVEIGDGPFDRDGGRTFYARDPDGYRIEFYYEAPD
jgi:catechol 2,3-dioxygenase-like lactoylglutathione lyase family enzyme